MAEPTKPDVVLVEFVDIPCEYRLQNKKTGKFIFGGHDVDKRFVDNWIDAAYFISANHDQSDPSNHEDESSLEFQWNWMKNECEETWMEDEDINDYRVHVVIGLSDA